MFVFHEKNGRAAKTRDAAAAKDSPTGQVPGEAAARRTSDSASLHLSHYACSREAKPVTFFKITVTFKFATTTKPTKYK
jgi:hypothetical protein